MIAQIRTKNHSARPLKGKIYSPFRAVVRLGSRTPTENIFPSGCRNNKKIIEIIQPLKLSSFQTMNQNFFQNFFQSLLFI